MKTQRVVLSYTRSQVMGDSYMVEKTTNILSPSPGDVLDKKAVESLIEKEIEVEVKKRS